MGGHFASRPQETWAESHSRKGPPCCLVLVSGCRSSAACCWVLVNGCESAAVCCLVCGSGCENAAACCLVLVNGCRNGPCCLVLESGCVASCVRDGALRGVVVSRTCCVSRWVSAACGLVLRRKVQSCQLGNMRHVCAASLEQIRGNYNVRQLQEPGTSCHVAVTSAPNATALLP
jgi:hypothetical protein